MAGDWIKVRGELASHPKLVSIYNTLLLGEDPGLLVYVCGSDALGIGVVPPSNETVTERALRIVTEPSLRDVTLCALLRVWCAVNAHCKLDRTDAIMAPMTIYDLDGIVGFSGFGAAMLESGWVIEDEPNCLRFPNFLEFNEPACIRNIAMTNSERQRLFRERHKQNHTTNNGGVTKVTKSNGREEKRREEKREEKPLPLSLAIPDFQSAWSDWQQHRREIKKPMTPGAATKALAKLEAMGPARAVAALNHSIANGWIGIYEPKPEDDRNGKPSRPRGNPVESPARVHQRGSIKPRYWQPTPPAPTAAAGDGPEADHAVDVPGE